MLSQQPDKPVAAKAEDKKEPKIKATEDVNNSFEISSGVSDQS